jgi:D-alanyl-D-alanine dipeptidase
VFLAVGFEPATVDSRELYAPTERRVGKVDIYIHRTKATNCIRHATSSKTTAFLNLDSNAYCFLQWDLNPQLWIPEMWIAESFMLQREEEW